MSITLRGSLELKAQGLGCTYEHHRDSPYGTPMYPYSDPWFRYEKAYTGLPKTVLYRYYGGLGRV